MRFVSGLAAIPVLLLVTMVIQSPAVAATFNVSDVAGLRSALLAAATNLEDDVIVLAAGTYATGGTTFTFTTNETNTLTLRGANGATRDQVVLDGGGASQVLTTTCVGSCGAITLQGLTVQNGYATGYGHVSGGGVNASTILIVSDVSFSGNHAEASGGAISGSGNVTNSVFTNNTSRGDGGAISGDVTITDSTFTNNATGGRGGAISGIAVTVTNSVFSNNTASSGGAISRAGVTVINSTFTNNTATSGLGGAIFGAVTVTNSTFTDNSAHLTNGGGGGGAIYGAKTVTNSIFNNNSVSGGDGGAIYGTGTVINSIFNGNTTASGLVGCSYTYCRGPEVAGGRGGAISGNWIVANSTFSGNSASDSGAAIYLSSPSAIINSLFNGHSIPAIDAWSAYNLYNNLIDINTGIAGSTPLLAGNVAPGATSPFVDAANGNFQLTAGSPAINAGLDPNSTTFANLVGNSADNIRQLLLTDLQGNPRPSPGTAVDIGAYESGYTTANLNPPTCVLTATPALITVGDSSTLAASCSPAATSFEWTGGSCAGTNTAICTVTPSATTTYSVTGSNANGTGNTARTTVVMTNVTTPTISSVLPSYGIATIKFTTSPLSTSYTAMCSAAGQTTRTATGTNSPITVQGLNSGVSYSCSVTASNGTTTGVPSEPVQVTAKSVVPMMMLLMFD